MHVPVLQKEVLQYLDPKPGENFIDCTIGETGHSIALLEKIAPKGRLLGIDMDAEMLKTAKAEIGISYKDRLILVNDSYVNLKEIVENHKLKPIDGILLDLGMSSWHLEKSGKGFSFQKREPLDMRYDSQNQLTAEKIINYWSRFDLEKIFKEYGEEKFSRQIAKNIIESRKLKPIKNTVQLVEVIRSSVPRGYQRGKIHFATKTFQALRIAVNDELNNLKKVLPQSLEILNLGGRLVVISFHSLEDRIVKNFFREKVNKEFSEVKVLTKKPVTADFSEVKKNPRSRSAKLRAVIKLNPKI